MKIFLLKLPEYLDFNHESFLSKYVDTEKKAIIDKYIKKEDRYRSLLGDVLVRYVCMKELKVSNNELIFDKNSYGKPYLRNDSKFHFNISHSGNWIVCVVGNTPVGVDIEEITNIDLNLTKYFSKWEEAYIHSGVDIEKKERFFDIWTLKESYIKAVGKGLSIKLDSFSIMFEGSDFKLKTNNFDEDKYFFKQYNLLPEYKLSVCSMNNNFPKKVEYVDTLVLLSYLQNTGGSYNE